MDKCEHNRQDDACVECLRSERDALEAQTFTMLEIFRLLDRQDWSGMIELCESRNWNQYEGANGGLYSCSTKASDYEWTGEFETDARHTAPERMKLLATLTRGVLAGTNTAREMERVKALEDFARKIRDGYPYTGRHFADEHSVDDHMVTMDHKDEMAVAEYLGEIWEALAALDGIGEGER